MNITETSAEGLKREFQVVIPANDIEEKVNGRLEEMRRTAQLPGFRPGKVPASVIRQRYRAGALGEVLEKVLDEAWRGVLTERSLKAALQPKIDVESFEDGKDLSFKMAVELLPEFEPGEISGIELERLVTEVADAAVEESLKRLAEARKVAEPAPEGHEAAAGDSVVIDFAGTVDGVAKEGMDAQGYPLELGAGRFIPGFEEQLIGIKAGEHRTVTVTFPESYPAAELAGKEAVFEIDAKEIRVGKLPEIDDELAKSFGTENLDDLKKSIRERIQKDYAEVSRQRIKRQLLDKLAEAHSFPVPEGMVEIEFEAIWNRVQEEIAHGHAPEEAKKPEDELKAEYRAIAERRVRLGLLLSEIGRRNTVEVSQEEINKALIAEVRRYPGQEREVFDFYRKNPQAIENLRAPLFEDKVVDFILELAKITERTVSIEELLRDPDEEDVKAA
jgi:trigger factor